MQYFVYGRADAEAARTFAIESRTTAPALRHVILYGGLLGPGSEARLGRAAMVEAPDRESAGSLLGATGDGRTEVHPWRFGGRPAQGSQPGGLSAPR